ncbi:MAG TPA: regulatory protein RecX [Vicinamibacteria bacterium]|nr:regulatory protein RecX [Vicinamibacteria bacterium]
MTIARPAPQSPASAWGRALRLLARRDRSEQELRRALLRGGTEDHEVEAILERLRARGYLDDERYAERFARSGLAVRGLGRHRLRAELLRRGIRRPVLERGLAEALGEVPEVAVVETQALKYWRLHQRDLPARRIQKLWAFLLRRGFPADLVRERLEHLWPRASRTLPGFDHEAPDTFSSGTAVRRRGFRQKASEPKP